MVCAYVFDDGKTYIGITRRKPSDRHSEHKRNPRSSVKTYADRMSSDIPDMLILDRDLDERSAQRLEELYTQAIPPDLSLNRGKTGVGTGSTGQPESTMSPEEKRAKKAAYRRSHRKERNEYSLKYRREHPEQTKAARSRHREAARQRRLLNPELAEIERMRSRKYYSEHRDERLAYKRRHRQSQKDQYKVYAITNERNKVMKKLLIGIGGEVTFAAVCENTMSKGPCEGPGLYEVYKGRITGRP